MLKQRLIDNYLHQPLARKAAIICTAICLGTAIILLIANAGTDRRLIQHSSQLLGDSLTRQLALEASNPLVQGDKLSLQSLLNKLVESPLIIHGVIFDASNQAIVEAGPQQSQGQSLSAQVTFQDSIAGYVVVTMDTSPLQAIAATHSRQLLLLALLLCTAGYGLSLLAGNYLSAILNDLRVIAGTSSRPRGAHSQTRYPGSDELQQLARQIIAGPTPPLPTSTAPATAPGCAAVIIRLSDIDALMEQQTPSKQRLLATLERQIAMVCQLYNGRISAFGHDGICLLFAADNQENSYPFKALCSALLLLEWLQSSQWNLAAGMAYDPELVCSEDNSSLQQQLQRQQLLQTAAALATTDQQLLIPEALCQHDSIVSRVLAKPLDNSPEADCSVVRIEQLAAPYSALLGKQLSSLKAQLDC